MSTLGTQCKPQQRSLTLQELGSFLSRCHILTPLIWSSHSKAAKSKARLGPVAITGITGTRSCSSQKAQFSSMRNGLTQERDEGFPWLLPHLPVCSRNFSQKGNRCRALHPSAIPSQSCCCCLGAPSQKLHGLEQPGMVRTWRKSSVRLLNTLDLSGVLGNSWLSWHGLAPSIKYPHQDKNYSPQEKH